MARLISEDKIIWPESETGRPRKKQFLADINTEYTGYSSIVGEKFYTRDGNKEQMELWGEIVFDFPKNSGIIGELIEQVAEDGDIILDSFSGSGTTAHAVLNANKADNGNRRFILIEMEDYADTITAERVKRVIKGYGEDKKKVPGTGGNFSYYELGSPIFKGDNLNEEIGEDEIRKYVYFTETKQLISIRKEEPKFMGIHMDTAYYFHYEKDNITTLNRDFLHTVKTKASDYVIYADLCTLSERELEKWHITFKKIPRDISKI